MLARGVRPDRHTLPRVLAASRLSGNFSCSKVVHGHAVKLGFASDGYVVTSLMAAYGQYDGVEAAERVFVEMRERNSVSWTLLASLYAMENRHESVLRVFYRMVSSGAEVDSVSLLSPIRACGRLRSAVEGRKVHGIAKEFGLVSDALVGNALVKMYFDCGCVEEARGLFDGMAVRDVVSWTALIGGYVQNGGFNEGLKLLRLMVEDGAKPDSVAVASVLPACARVSAHKNGKEIHSYVIRNGVEMNLNVENALMDMYIKSGCMKFAMKIFENIGNKDMVSWTVMILGCSLHGQAELGLELFNASEMDPGVQPDEMLHDALLHACYTTGKVEEGRFYFKSIREHKIGQFALMVGLLARAGLLKDAEAFMSEHSVDGCPEVLRALLDECRISRNLLLGKKVAEKLMEIEPLNAENYVLLSNIHAANGRWEPVARLKQMIVDMGLSTKKACSWIEIRNKVHVFETGDTSHPRSDEIHLELSYVRKRMEEEDGYCLGDDFALHDVDEERESCHFRHSEMLAVAFGLISTRGKTTIRVAKNLRVCRNCHISIKMLAKIIGREIVLKDPYRYHHFKNGGCSCCDFW